MAQPPQKPPPQPQGTPPAAGRITHDARGNAVWTWISESGRVAIDSTSRLLKRLDSSDLRLEDTETTAVAPPAAPHSGSAVPEPGSAKAAAAPRGPTVQSGYDPYSSRTPARPKPTLAPAPKPATKKPPSQPPPRASLLGRIFGRK
jgi:hypothetical protein